MDSTALSVRRAFGKGAEEKSFAAPPFCFACAFATLEMRPITPRPSLEPVLSALMLDDREEANSMTKDGDASSLGRFLGRGVDCTGSVAVVLRSVLD